MQTPATRSVLDNYEGSTLRTPSLAWRMQQPSTDHRMPERVAEKHHDDIGWLTDAVTISVFYKAHPSTLAADPGQHAALEIIEDVTLAVQQIMSRM